jgi:hypothetical protein
MISLYPVIAKQLALQLDKVFRLKPMHGEPYPAQYCLWDRDFVWRRDASWDWSSVTTSVQQMRILCALLRGDVEVVKDA